MQQLQLVYNLIEAMELLSDLLWDIYGEDIIENYLKDDEQPYYSEILNPTDNTQDHNLDELFEDQQQEH